MNDNSDSVAQARQYLEAGGLGEVIGLVEMVNAHGLPKVQIDTDMAIALCQMASERTTKPVGSIEHDKDDPSREYIPLPAGWEIQTKGRGSSYRLLDRKTGERLSILCNDGQIGRDFVTRMAREINAAGDISRRRDVLEEAAKVADAEASITSGICAKRIAEGIRKLQEG